MKVRLGELELYLTSRRYNADSIKTPVLLTLQGTLYAGIAAFAQSDKLIAGKKSGMKEMS